MKNISDLVGVQREVGLAERDGVIRVLELLADAHEVRHLAEATETSTSGFKVEGAGVRL
jgi:hypothetical protein